MNWTEFLTDTRKISAIFGEKKPSLKMVNIHEVLLIRDGPKVVFRFDLSEFPESPPKKWKESGFNCVQVQLTALGIHNLKIEGLGSNCQCSIFISDKDDLVSLNVGDGEIKVSLLAEYLLIDKISAYQNS